MVKTHRNVNNWRSAAKPAAEMPGAVQRLDVSGVPPAREKGALRYSPASVEKREGDEIPMVARLKLKGIDGRAPPGVD